MTLAAAVLVGVGILLWPGRFRRHHLSVLPVVPPASIQAPRSARAPVWALVRRYLPSRSPAGVSAADLLGLLDAIAPALEAGIAPASALRLAAEARSDGQLDPLGSLARDLASAGARGATLAPMWGRAADATGSAELRLLAQAWSLTEDMGVPLAQAVRATAGLLEARIAHERRLVSAVAGPKATVAVLTVLPAGGPLLALVLGIGPGELYGGSRLTQGSLALGLGLAGIGRWWVHRMVRTVARGPVVA